MNKIVPTRREKDPTGQAGNRLRAKAELSRRVRSLREPVLQMLDDIPVERIEVNKARYEYRVDPQRVGNLFDELLVMFYNRLELNEQGRNWWLAGYLDQSWQSGTAQAVQRIKTLSETVAPAASQALSVDAVLFSVEYARKFDLLSARAFEGMKGFAGQAAQDLGGILGRGLTAGQSPRDIAREIRKKFDQIEGYRALRIARTEVNNAYNEARYEAALNVRDRQGIEIRVMHLSALVASTRASHAARHGKIYTLEEQQEWWQSGSNKINCLCSTVEIVYINGEPAQKSLIERQRKRGKAFFSAQ